MRLFMSALIGYGLLDSNFLCMITTMTDELKERLEGLTSYFSSALKTVTEMKSLKPNDEEFAEDLDHLDDLIYFAEGTLYSIKRFVFFDEPFPPSHPSRTKIISHSCTPPPSPSHD